MTRTTIGNPDINRIVERSNLNGGGTFHTDGSEPTTGYAVGGLDVPSLMRPDGPDGLRPEWVRTFVNLHPDVQTLGTWLDRETDIWYIDAVTVTDDLALALAMAKDADELAVYDLCEGREIRL